MTDEVHQADWPHAGLPARETLEQRVSLFYEQTRNDVYRYLVVRGVDPGPAQDFTQEAFLRLYQALIAGTAIRSPRAWVFAVAHNLAESWRLAEPAVRDADLEPEAAAEGGSNPESRLIVAERFQRLRDAVLALSPQQRQCLHLRAEGFRYREIGGILGIGTSTVSEFLRRAIQRLRKAVEE